MDTFDPKPKLNELAGQPLPPGYKRVITAMGEINSPLLASKRKWKQYGESGIWVSDWLPHTAQCVDDLAVIRSCWTNGINHSGGVCQMNTGTPIAGRPSLGAWVSYGLGTENANLPAFVVMTDSTTSTINGPRNWSAGFMPAGYQGSSSSPRPIRSGIWPIPRGSRSNSSGKSWRPDLDELGLRAQASPADGAGCAGSAAASWPSGCRLTLPRRSIWPRRRSATQRRTALTGSRPPRLAGTVCSPGGWSSAACGLSSSITGRGASGTPTRDREEPH